MRLNNIFIEVLLHIVGGESMETSYKDYFVWRESFTKAMKSKIANIKMPGAGMRF